jgi:hypothetical protein
VLAIENALPFEKKARLHRVMNNGFWQDETINSSVKLSSEMK